MDNMKSATIAQEPLSEKYPWITEDMLKEMWKLWVGNEGWNSLCVKFFEYILDQQPKQEQGNTLEQIEEAMLRAHCHGYMIRDALEYLAPKPKPKTPEERVCVAVHLADDDFSGFNVCVDGVLKARFCNKKEAEIHRLGWIAELKEADRG